MMRRWVLVGVIAMGAAGKGSAADPDLPPAAGFRDLTELSLTDLAEMKVTSVSRSPEEVSRTAAAISVITGEEIRDSGASDLADVLRLAPGVHVARIDANQWALGIRGFTSNLARDQLALMDGRTLYSPLFAGTYWDVQDTMLEDIDRIEVVRGPGGTLWGANAVNGIVNIITKSSKDTQGGLIVLGGGGEERAFTRARYGGKLGGSGAFRVYGKYFDRDASFGSGGDDFDGWHMGQGGFRADWDLGPKETLTVQGDLYVGRAGHQASVTSFEPPYRSVVTSDAELGGGNVLSRWSRTFSDGGELSAEAYYDHTHRQEPTFREDRDTGDVDVTYRPRRVGRHQVVLGAEYRVSDGRTNSPDVVAFVPPNRTDNLFSAFAEDAVRLVPDRLQLTVGSKLLWNDYTGLDLQPSARLAWTPHGRHTIWAAITRAVRTPSRVERDLSISGALSATQPIFAVVSGDPDFQSETELAYEAGYRVRIGERLLLDTAAFYNRYPNLLSIEASAPFVDSGRQILPYGFANGLEGRVSGFELGSDVRLGRRWTVRPAYSYLNMDLAPRPGSKDTTSVAAEGSSPRHMVSVQSSWTPTSRWSLDGWYRWTSRLPTQKVPAYSSLDLRAACRLRGGIALAIVGQNLLEPHHPEFGGGREVQRSAYADVTWQF